MNVKRGDVFFTRGSSLLSRLIRWAERAPGEEPSWANHTGLFVSSGNIMEVTAIEALGNVKRHRWWDAHSNSPGYEVEVYRLEGISSEQIERVCEYANSHVGDTYGWWKLLFHLGDRAFFKGKKVISSLLRIEGRPICSFLVAMAYAKAGINFNGFRPEAADPDEMHDYVTWCPKWKYVGKEIIP